MPVGGEAQAILATTLATMALKLRTRIWGGAPAVPACLPSSCLDALPMLRDTCRDSLIFALCFVCCLGGRRST